MSQTKVVIAGTNRLAVGKFGGAFLNSKEVDMASTVMRAAIERSGIEPGQIDEVIFAQNYRSGKTPPNSARVYAWNAGVPIEVPSFTVNKHCASSLRSVMSAAQAIKAGDAEVVLAGGIELMSDSAYFLPGKLRWGGKIGHQQMQDPMVMFDPIVAMTTIQTSNKMASVCNISRAEQDEFALLSQQRAEAAIKSGKFDGEITPIEVKSKKGNVMFQIDECPRFGSTMEKLASLKAVLEGGTVTAGNASVNADGASATMVLSAARAEELGIKPLAEIVGYASAGVDPSLMGIGPVPATKKLLDKVGLKPSDIDLVEINEAFAAVVVNFAHELGISYDRINPNGGALALGHPISATGTVLLSKLVYELKRRGGKYGLVTLCIGGGQGASLLIKNSDVD